MEWFRFWNGTLNSLKVQSLKPDVFKTWVNLLCLASQEDDGGLLPYRDEIAFSLRINDRLLTGHLSILCEAGLLEEEEGNRLRIHDWHEWQPAHDDPAERMRRYRERKRNVTGNGNVAQPLRNAKRNANRNCSAPRARSDSETETETDKDNNPLPPTRGKIVESLSEETEPPEYPDPVTTIITIQSGDHTIPETKARQIWGHLWRTWHNHKLCFGFYEMQRGCSTEGWLYAIETALKQGKRPEHIKYLQKIGMNMDLNGPKREKPLQKGDIGSVPYKPTYISDDGTPVKTFPIYREQGL